MDNVPFMETVESFGNGAQYGYCSSFIKFLDTAAWRVVSQGLLLILRDHVEVLVILEMIDEAGDEFLFSQFL